MSFSIIDNSTRKKVHKQFEGISENRINLDNSGTCNPNIFIIRNSNNIKDNENNVKGTQLLSVD